MSTSKKSRERTSDDMQLSQIDFFQFFKCTSDFQVHDILEQRQ